MAKGTGRSGPDGGTPGSSTATRRQRREIARIVVAVVGLILLVAFVLDNSHTVKVGFVFFSTRISLIWVLLIAAVLGGLVDRLTIIIGQRRRKAAAAKASRQLT